MSFDDDGQGDNLINAGIGQFELDGAAAGRRRLAAGAVDAGLIRVPNRIAGLFLCGEPAVRRDAENGMLSRVNQTHLIEEGVQPLSHQADFRRGSVGNIRIQLREERFLTVKAMRIADRTDEPARLIERPECSDGDAMLDGLAVNVNRCRNGCVR